MSHKKILHQVANYYSEKIKLHGATARGVDWNSEQSQELRFEQLIKVLDFFSEPISILDYGCGYGAMFSYLQKNFKSKFLYIGYDISDDMINKASSMYKTSRDLYWINHLDHQKKQPNFVIASGIFNVKLNNNDENWLNYILETLHQLNDLSTSGFSFNMLTSYSDKGYMREDLFYGNPGYFFDYCKTNFSDYVSLIHDYPLYEFTILVKKLNP